MRRRSFLRLAVQPGRFPIADDVDRRRAAIGDAVGDGIDLAVEFDAARLILELVAKQAEQRHHPLLARLGRGRRIGLE